MYHTKSTLLTPQSTYPCLYRSLIYPLRLSSPNKPMDAFPLVSAIFFNLANGTANAYALACPTSASLLAVSGPMGVVEKAVYAVLKAPETLFGLQGWTQLRMALGVVLFLAGMVINHHSDNILRGLRHGSNKEGKGNRGSSSSSRSSSSSSSRSSRSSSSSSSSSADSSSTYSIPHGGAFKLVSAANYLGEIIEWFGFALAVSTPAAWLFAASTAANLVPRGVAYHNDYLKRFGDRYPKGRWAVLPGIL